MASLRYRNDKWQVQVRRYGHTAQSKSFRSKADAQRWARHVEAELDRTLVPDDPRLLSTITVGEVLRRYRDTHTQTHRGQVSEAKRIEVFLRTDWSKLPLAKANPALFSRYRDSRLNQVRPGTVIRELGLLRSIFETGRREWGYASFLNPVAEIEKPRAPEGRERRLRPGEFNALITACNTITC
jgi:hypothetical protein